MWLIWLAGSAVLVWALAQTGWTPALVMVAVGLLLVAYWLSPLVRRHLPQRMRRARPAR